MSNNNEGVRARIETTAGTMVVEFKPDVAPNHVANFLKLAEDGFYDGTRFHRVIPGFMIQGGCPNTKDLNKDHTWGTGGPGWNVDAEFNKEKHTHGVLSAARSQDPNSAGSQFFVCHGDAAFLDGQYTVFGNLVEGDDTLDSIANAATVPGGEGSKPVDPVQITKVTVERPE